MNNQVLEWHLLSNQYPPIEGDFAHKLASNAIEMVLAGKGGKVVRATGGIFPRRKAAISWPEMPERKVTAEELVEAWHLEDFVEMGLAGAGQIAKEASNG